MSNRKAPERRNTIDTRQDSSDLNMAITELHQTIVRLNKAIDRVKPDTKHSNTLMDTRDAINAALEEPSDEPCLANLNVPKIFH